MIFMVHLSSWLVASSFVYFSLDYLGNDEKQNGWLATEMYLYLSVDFKIFTCCINS